MITFFQHVILTLVFVLTCVLTACCQSDNLLIKYNFDGYQDEDDGDYPPSEVNSSLITVSDFSQGGDLEGLPTPANDVFSARGWPTTIINPSDEYYFEFSITPTDLNYIDLTSIKFDIKRSSLGPQNFVLRSNIEHNFTVNINDQVITVEEEFSTFTTILNDDYFGHEETLTIRLYGYNSNDEWGSIQIDNLEIYGEAFDATPPSMISGYPNISNITQSGFDFSVSADERGTAYVYVQEDGEIPPSTDDVINNAVQTINVNAVGTEYTSNISNLFPSTTYDAFFVLEDDEGNTTDSPINSDNITTLNLDNILVQNGATRTISKDVTVNDFVQINAGGQLTLNENVTLSLHGDLINDGDIADEGGTLHFTGASAQQILGSNTITPNNITISNPAGVTNETSVALLNKLKLNENAVFDADGSNNDQTFTLVSTETQTAQITTIENGASLSGDITMQRHIGDGPVGWRYISLPIKNQTTDGLQDDLLIQGVDNNYPNADPQLYTYDESKGSDAQSGSDGWEGITSSSYNISNQGLQIYLFQRDFKNAPLMLDYTGSPFIGDGNDNTLDVSGETYELGLDYTSSSLDGGGWNLIQNPYPAKIDWDKVALSENVGGAIYIWNQNIRNWGVYTQAGGATGGASQYIAPGQSFFVKANAPGQTITFEEEDKVDVEGNTFLREGIQDDWFKINIAAEDEVYQDELLIKQDENSTYNYDMHTDALERPNGWINMGAMKNDTTNLCIYSAPPSPGIDTISLKVIPYYFGDYTMHFKQKNGLEGKFIIRDRYNGQTIDPDTAKHYSMSILKNDSASFINRFDVLLMHEVDISIDTASAKAGDTVKLNVNTNGFKEVHSVEIDLSWDNEALDFVGFSPKSLPGVDSSHFNSSASGDLSFNWSMPDSEVVALNSDKALFTLKFIVKGNQDVTNISFKEGKGKIKSRAGLVLPAKMKNGLINIVNKELVEGKVLDAFGNPVSGVSINFDGSLSNNTTTRDDGTFEFESWEGVNYKLSASKSSSQEPVDIDLLDLLQLRTHLSGTGDFGNNRQFIAADVNHSHSLDESDIALIKDHLLKHSNPMSKWLFISGGISLSIDPLDYNTTGTYHFNDDHPVEFTGIKVGDVAQKRLETSGNTIKVSIGSFEGSNPEQKMVSISPIDSIGLLGFKMNISYDAKSLNLLRVTHPSLPGEVVYHEYKKGQVMVIWESASGRTTTFVPKVGLFNMVFEKLNKKIDIENKIAIDAENDASIAIDKFLEPHSIARKETVTSLPNQRDQFILAQNAPNPADNYTTFTFYLPKEGDIDLSVYNLVGDKVYNHQDTYKKGWNTISWQLNNQGKVNIEPGVYVYIVTSSGVGYVKKLVIQ